MNEEELQKAMAESDVFEMDVTVHAVKALRALADKIESGQETSISAFVKVARAVPGVTRYEFVTKKN